MIRNASALMQVMRESGISRVELQPRVRERLRKTLVTAFRHVPYYRETMKAAGYDPERDFNGPADLQKLPILTKQTIQELGTEAFLNRKADLSRCIFDRTSGSTGRPLEIWRGPQSQALVLARFFRVLMANGYRFTDKVLGFRPQTTEVVELGGPLRHLGLLRWRKVDLKISPSEMVDHLLGYEPEVLYGNLIHFELIAREIERRNVRLNRIKLLVPGGEVVTEWRRQRLEKALGGRVAVTYGTAEMGTLAFDTPRGRGHRLCEDLIWYEFLDDAGVPAAAGQNSRIITTDLTNDVMPFIRYDHEDRVTLEPETDGAEGDWRRLRSIDGRQSDAFVLSDGSLYTYLIPAGIIKQFPGVRQFRLIQKDVDLVHIQLLGDRGYLEEIRGKLMADFRERSPGFMRFDLIAVDELLPDANGKFRMLVSEVDR